MWDRAAPIAEQNIFDMLCKIRQGDGVSSQVLRHSKRVFALLGAADLQEATKILKDATSISPGDKHLEAAANALNLDGRSSTLTQRRKLYIEDALLRNRRAPSNPCPTSVVGLKNWEDTGLRKIAAHLLRRMPSADPDVAIGKLNARIFALEAALQREQQLARYRDEKIQSALFETAAVIAAFLKDQDGQTADVRAKAMERVTGLQRLYLGPSGAVRPLDLSGNRSAGLFAESLDTQSIATVRRTMPTDDTDELLHG